MVEGVGSGGGRGGGGDLDNGFPVSDCCRQDQVYRKAASQFMSAGDCQGQARFGTRVPCSALTAPPLHFSTQPQIAIFVFTGIIFFFFTTLPKRGPL